MIITTINTQDLYFPTLQKKHTHQLLSSQPHTLINHTAHPPTHKGLCSTRTCPCSQVSESNIMNKWCFRRSIICKCTPDPLHTSALCNSFLFRLLHCVVMSRQKGCWLWALFQFHSTSTVFKGFTPLSLGRWKAHKFWEWSPPARKVRKEESIISQQ